MWGSSDPILEFWDPLISRERLELENSNLARRQTSVTCNEKIAKLCQKGSCRGHVTHFWYFGTPPNIPGTVGARNFKFGTETEGGVLTKKMQNCVKRGHVGVT